MNVFEDLIVELKQENLLEKTVIDPRQTSGGGKNNARVPGETAAKSAGVGFRIEAAGMRQGAHEAPRVSAPPLKAKNNSEFYKKRAVGELSNLQMVEHVLTGIEREYLKVIPRTFDDFAAKKALHALLQAAGGDDASQQAEAEFAMMTETEAWCTALGKRDAGVPVSSVRLFCENSHPVLSSHALTALARFYRNLPYTEAVRAKFDFVMTRLFSRIGEDGTRSCTVSREELLKQIETMYSEWASIALYKADDEESNALLASLSFEDLAIEAENTATFDALIQTNFFSRLRLFKESISELFYAPNVTAAAIECNIRVGNAYVKLLSLEREKTDIESIQTKYGTTNDEEASDAAGHTLDLVAIIGDEAAPDVAAEPEVQPAEPVSAGRERLDARALTATSVPPPVIKPGSASLPRTGLLGALVENARGINRWFLGISVLLVGLSMSLYVWSNYFVTSEASTSGVQTVAIAGPGRDHVHTARISGTTFYALMQPTWDNLPKETRIEVLKAIYQFAGTKGCRQVRLTNREGKAAGFASATRVEVDMP